LCRYQVTWNGEFATDHGLRTIETTVKNNAPDKPLIFKLAILHMKKPIKIGEKTFIYKKDALLHFKRILNSYGYDEVLTPTDFEDVLNLLRLHERATEKIDVGVREIRVDEIRYKTKCFRIIRVDSSSDVFSYTKCINGGLSQIEKFRRTCRHLVNDDLRNVKLAYFKSHSRKGKVKCQETGEWCYWEELNVDHRQPNTFSVIVDRFIEVNGIVLDKVKYLEVVDAVYKFEDEFLCKSFREYHQEKSNLRLVKRRSNLGRSHQARLKRQAKDLLIE
jgi:hypothetical protein